MHERVAVVTGGAEAITGQTLSVDGGLVFR